MFTNDSPHKDDQAARRHALLLAVVLGPVVGLACDAVRELLKRRHKPRDP